MGEEETEGLRDEEKNMKPCYFVKNCVLLVVKKDNIKNLTLNTEL
jgi:hypothetical protein